MEASTQETMKNQTWKDVLAEENGKAYFTQLIAFVEGERAQGKEIYPPTAEVFTALKLVEFHAVKVVILGQDPYFNPGQAHGLCFSVKPGVPPPPSLVNIYKEIKADLGLPIPSHGYLEHWAKQGILLLNSVMTVERGKPFSHAKRGWEQFTDTIIAKLNTERSGLIFMLWGTPAQKKAAFVDAQKHVILKAPHPSPLSASRGFIGCKHFSKCNQL